MKQKLGLIQAMMHRPDLLILDEPTIALDPLVRETLATELRQVAAEGRTVLFSSHTLGEVEQLCDWVGILKAGKLVEQQRIEELRTRALRRVEIVWASAIDRAAPLPDGLQVSRRDEERIIGRWVGPVQPLLNFLAGAKVRDVIITPPNLEDLFMTYYGDDSPEGTP